MFRKLRRLFEAYKESLYDSYEKKPVIYKLGKKRYVKVKRLHNPTKKK